MWRHTFIAFFFYVLASKTLYLLADVYVMELKLLCQFINFQKIEA